MKEVHFPEWKAALDAAGLSNDDRRSYFIIIRWYLGFCRRCRVGATVQSARDFIEWAQQQKKPNADMLEGWREAIRWFFRNGGRRFPEKSISEQAGPSSSTDLEPDDSIGTSPRFDRVRRMVSERTSEEARDDSGGATGWKREFLTVVRRRNMAYRTEQSYLV